MTEEQSYIEEYIKELKGKLSALIDTQFHHIGQTKDLERQISGLQEVIERLERD